MSCSISGRCRKGLPYDKGGRVRPGCLRFLWVKDIHAETPEIQTLKFTRVVFGMSPSPYILNATIAHHHEQFESTQDVTARKLKESIYVDDVIAGARDIEEAFNLYRESKEIFKKGGFNLRKFMSNSKELQSIIDTSEFVSNVTAVEEYYAQTTLAGQHKVSKDEHKVLGII